VLQLLSQRHGLFQPLQGFIGPAQAHLCNPTVYQHDFGIRCKPIKQKKLSMKLAKDCSSSAVVLMTLLVPLVMRKMANAFASKIYPISPRTLEMALALPLGRPTEFPMVKCGACSSASMTATASNDSPTLALPVMQPSP
jgi:hypothetical protein